MGYQKLEFGLSRGSLGLAWGSNRAIACSYGGPLDQLRASLVWGIGGPTGAHEKEFTVLMGQLGAHLGQFRA